MELGTVKWFNEKKGVGLITPIRGGDDVFVHAGVIQGERALMEGQAVRYERVEAANGARARAVHFA